MAKVKFANHVSFELERFMKILNAVIIIRCPYNTEGGKSEYRPVIA